MTDNPKFVYGRENPNYTGPTRASASAINVAEITSPISDFDNSGQGHNIQELSDFLEDSVDFLSEQEDRDSADYDDLRTQMAWASSRMPKGYREEKDMGDFLGDVHEPGGGGTWNPFTKDVPDSGFFYTPYPNTKLFDSYTDISAGAINDYIEENRELLEKDDHYLGIWHDDETGKVYLDTSTRTMDASVARRECEKADQISFYDPQENNSVTVNQNAQSGL